MKKEEIPKGISSFSFQGISFALPYPGAFNNISPKINIRKMTEFHLLQNKESTFA